jgi:predicted MPP superfamily phosphohydrolase
MSSGTTISRRHFLAAGAAALGSAALPAAEARATDRVGESHYEVRIHDLAPSLTGVCIAQVSDLHLYDGVHPAAERALSVLDRERPDLIVLTGDQWDRVAGAHAFPAWLRQLPPRVPVVAVLGNHEFSSGFSPAQAERVHRAGGAHLLVNEATTVAVRGGRISVVGLEDYRHGRGEAPRALDAVTSGAPQVWLQHEPEQMDATRWPAGATAGLVLGGHTHGGQLRVPALPPVTPRGSGRYVAGWYESPVGRYYVSRGVGTSGVRLRMWCPAELPIFTLVPA